MASTSAHRSDSLEFLQRMVVSSRPYLRWYVPIALCLAAASLGNLILTDALRRLVDAVSQSAVADLWLAFGIGLAGFAASTLCSVVANYMRAYVDQQSVMARQAELVGKLQRVHYDYCTGEHSGDLITRIVSNASEAQVGLNQALVDIVRHGTGIASTTVYLFWLNWQLAVGCLIAATVVPLLMNLASGRMRRLWNERWQKEGELSALIQDSVQGAEIARAHGLQGWLLERFDAAYDVLMRLIRRAEWWNQAVNAGGPLVFLTGLFFVLGYGGSLVVREVITVGTVTAFLVSFEQVSWPVQGLLNVWPNLQKSLAAAQRVYDLLDAPYAPGMESEGVFVPLPDVTALRAINFANVTFRYPNRDRNVLEGLSAYMPAHQFTALVGETGSGKTTLLRLLLRLFAPNSGAIVLEQADGSTIDLADIPVAAWRDVVGYVPQDVVLFSGTLAENIALGYERWQYEDELQERLDQVVKLTLLDELVGRLPKGLETAVGEGGTKLSGGERQRVALARAAFRDPALLLLDEATSSLDNQSERLIQEALLQVSAGRTTIAIAHRLSTVVHADQILVIADGQVVERGSHEQLLAAGGRYSRLFVAGQADAMQDRGDRR